MTADANTDTAIATSNALRSIAHSVSPNTDASGKVAAFDDSVADMLMQVTSFAHVCLCAQTSFHAGGILHLLSPPPLQTHSASPRALRAALAAQAIAPLAAAMRAPQSGRSGAAAEALTTCVRASGSSLSSAVWQATVTLSVEPRGIDAAGAKRRRVEGSGRAGGAVCELAQRWQPQSETAAKTRVHPGVCCDACGVMPIAGTRYTSVGEMQLFPCC